MRALLQFLDGKKTHLAAFAILALLFGTWQGWWKVPSEVYEALLAAGLIFLRLGVSKIATQADGRSEMGDGVKPAQTANSQLPTPNL